MNFFSSRIFYSRNYTELNHNDLNIFLFIILFELIFSFSYFYWLFLHHRLISSYTKLSFTICSIFDTFYTKIKFHDIFHF